MQEKDPINRERLNIKFKDFIEMDEAHIQSSYKRLLEKINNYAQPVRLINGWKITAIAASIALLVVSGIFFSLIRQGQKNTEIVYVTKNPSHINLPDGTEVWLGSNSRLKYPETFTGDFRGVQLNGEAYFEVVRNARHPFRISAGEQIVEVLGTSFSVRAYDDESEIITSLVEGSVKVYGQDSGEHTLTPGQQASYRKEDKSCVVSDFNVNLMMSWKTGKYVFENLLFEDIAHVLEKGFDVNIIIENKHLKTKPITAKFENGESLETILDLIGINAKYTYRYHNGVVTIK